MTRSELGFRAVGFLGSGLLRVWAATLRLRVRDREHLESFRRAGRPVIFAFWHAGILPLTYVHRNEGAVVLVSRHADGEYIARVLGRMGFRTARGSSTRGGVRGLRELVRAIREGRDVALTPDGPRGPARRVKPGALLLAQLTGAPVIPVGLRPRDEGSAGGWRLGSWDRFIVPRPFSAWVVSYGEPLFLPRDGDESARIRAAEELERVLDRLSGEAA